MPSKCVNVSILSYDGVCSFTAQDGACCYCCCGMFGPLLWGLHLFFTLLVGLIIIVLFGILEISVAMLFALCFLIVVHVLTIPMCFFMGPGTHCGGVCFVYAETAHKLYAVQLEEEQQMGKSIEGTSSGDVRSVASSSIASATYPAATGTIELTVGSVARSSTASPERAKRRVTKKRVTRTVFSRTVWNSFWEYATEDVVNLERMASICPLLSPLFMFLFIACAQSMISVFITYYVIDGDLFGSWFYFKPFWEGFREYALAAYALFKDPDALLEYMQYVMTLSISWRALLDFSWDHFDEFRLTILLLRTILFTIIGLMNSLSVS